MTHPHPFPHPNIFPIGIPVVIRMINSDNFSGEIESVVDGFLLVKLTSSTGPFVAGQTVLLNITLIEALG